MPIYICGFMGAGKSHCGRNAAQKLNLSFVDLDGFIIKESGMEITEIFSQYGEDYFREYEFSALKKTVGYDVVSLGGGALTFEKSRNFIKQNGTVIFINTDFDTCYDRIRLNTMRPLAASKSKAELKRLYNSRLLCYNEAADYTAENAYNVTDLVNMIRNLKKL